MKIPIDLFDDTKQISIVIIIIIKFYYLFVLSVQQLYIVTVVMDSCSLFFYLQDYITRRLQQERDQIEEDERLIRQYREETEKMRTEIEQLKST